MNSNVDLESLSDVKQLSNGAELVNEDIKTDRIEDKILDERSGRLIGDLKTDVVQNTVDNKKLNIEGVGLKAENQKIWHRTFVLFFLCIIIMGLLYFLCKLTWVMAIRETFIPESVYKFFISGVFINLLMLFRGITGYLYNNKSHSIVENSMNKNIIKNAFSKKKDENKL